MRVLISLFVMSFVISLVALSYMFGQKSVDVTLASFTTKTVSCIKENEDLNARATISFSPISHSKAATTDITIADATIGQPNETMDTTVIHAIRMGKWSEDDNRAFKYYISHLNKKERISVLKQLNKAINYQQMKIGSYIPKF